MNIGFLKRRVRKNKFKKNREIISILSRIAEFDSKNGAKYQELMNCLKDMVRVYRDHGASDSEVMFRMKVRETITTKPELLPYIFT